MAEEDEYVFWQPDRRRDLTGPIPRLSRRTPSVAPPTRRHGEARSHPTAADVPPFRSAVHDGHDLDDGHDLWDDFVESVPLSLVPQRPPRSPKAAPNFLLRRVAVLVTLGLVAAPMFSWFGSDDSGSSVAEGTVGTDQAQSPASLASVPTVAGVPIPAPSTNAAPRATAATAPSLTASTAVVDAVSQPATTTPPATASPTFAPTTAEPVVPATSAADTETATSLSSIGKAVDESAALDARPVEPAPVTVAVSCNTEYKVLQGDYWILIADKVGVSLSEVLGANDAKPETPLYPGTTICMPKDASAPTTAAPNTTAATKLPPTTPAPAPTTSTAPATTVAPKAAGTTVAPTTSTSPPTSTPPTTTAVAPKNTSSKAEVEAIIRSVWPDDLEDEAVRIATRESGLVPTVRNYCCYGLFQMYWDVHQSWMKQAGVTAADQLFDPRVNAYIAYSMYLRSGGWGPWT